jgi:hypothetical protein
VLRARVDAAEAAAGSSGRSSGDAAAGSGTRYDSGPGSFTGASDTGGTGGTGGAGGTGGSGSGTGGSGSGGDRGFPVDDA